MLRIRFARVGKRNQPHFRIVVQEHTVKPTGRFVELVGSYDPRQKTRRIKKDRARYWIEHGAQPTATVHNLLVSEGVIKGPKKRTTHAKTKKSEAAAEPAAPTAPAKETSPTQTAEAKTETETKKSAPPPAKEESAAAGTDAKPDNSQAPAPQEKTAAKKGS